MSCGADFKIVEARGSVGQVLFRVWEVLLRLTALLACLSFYASLTPTQGGPSCVIAVCINVSWHGCPTQSAVQCSSPSWHVALGGLSGGSMSKHSLQPPTYKAVK